MLGSLPVKATAWSSMTPPSRWHINSPKPGWLERRITDDTLGWFWTQQAEHALLSGQLVMSHENRQN